MKKHVLVISLLLVAILTICSTGSVVYAKSLSKPKLSNEWKVRTPENVIDGCVVRMKWGKVSGADGYQVKWFQYGEVTFKEFTKKNYVDFEGSDTNGVYIKVRAYKVSNGKKVFGKWSKKSVSIDEGYTL